VFTERLADALHRAALDLAARDLRADNAADVVDRRIRDHLDGTGVGIDLDLATCDTRWATTGPPTRWWNPRRCARLFAGRPSSNKPMARSVPATAKRPALYSMSAAGASSASAASLRASSIVRWRRHVHRRAADDSEREPALPEAVVAVGVAQSRRGCDRAAPGKTSTAAAPSWWRFALAHSPATADTTSIMPSGVTVTVTRSS